MNLQRIPTGSLKKVLCFPGQGQMFPHSFLSQLQSSGHDLTSFKSLLSNTINDQFKDNLFNSSNNERFFSKTSNLQPAIVSTSLLLLDLYSAKHGNVQASLVLGHSLGELTALIANGVWTREEGLLIAKKRGEFMEEAIDSSKSYGLIALMFSKPEQLEIIQDVINKFETVHLANKNSSTQAVLSGEKQQLSEAIDEIKRHIKVKAIELITNVPFHNPILKEASHNFSNYIESNHPYDKSKPLNVPIISNLTGEITTNQGNSVENFIKCFYNSVLFKESIDTVFQSGNEIEILNFGPNAKVTNGLFRKMSRDHKDVNFNSHTIESV